MQVYEVMTPHVEVIHPDATLKEAATKMSQLDIGPLPVCDGERLVGMLTDRDITIRATAQGCDPDTTKVRDMMTLTGDSPVPLKPFPPIRRLIITLHPGALVHVL